MKSNFLQLVSVASFLAALVTGSRALPKSVLDDCPSAEEVSSTTLMLNGEEILHQTFTCPDGIFTEEAPSRSSTALRKRTSLEKRSFIECDFTMPPPACQCGAQYQCACFQGDVAPAGFDCTQLVNSVTGANKGSLTFTVPPSGLEVLTLRTCLLSFMNLQDEALDFCWDSLNSIGQQAFNQCVIDESDRVVGGTCNPTNGQYRVTLGPVVVE
ncbi:hypothetical protein ACEPAG_8627 [Sanghuangporus baumii]